VPALLDRIATLAHVQCDGLMLVPPLADAEATRPHFRALRRLRDELARVARPRVDLRELSMGMSDDFEVAVEEGATMVRIGTALFGART
jgi:PLP dependent protein